MKINFFKPEHILFPFRWYIVCVVCLAGIMAYTDLTGMRLLSFSDGKQWNSSGPGFHK
jgi:hypothetical protein